MRSAVALLAILVLALTACGGSAQGDAQLAGTRLDPPFQVLDKTLTDTDGQPYSLADDTDKPLTLVFFGYTHCPDTCPAVMATLASAMTRLDAQDRDRVDVVFVTTDPARDTPAVLKRYLAHFDPDFLGLTGDLDTITAIAKPLGVGVSMGQKLPSGGYDVAHGATITGIQHGEGTVYWHQDASSGELASDIHTLLDD